MKKHLKLIVFLLWVLFVFGVIVPLTPRILGEFLVVGGTAFVMRASSHYLHYGKEGLKCWKWRHQPVPSMLDAP